MRLDRLDDLAREAEVGFLELMGALDGQGVLERGLVGTDEEGERLGGRESSAAENRQAKQRWTNDVSLSGQKVMAETKCGRCCSPDVDLTGEKVLYMPGP